MAPAQAHGLELGAETRLCSLPDDLALHPPFKFFACIFDISCVCICMYMYMYVYLIVNFFYVRILVSGAGIHGSSWI